jgi:two-component system, LytTR family, response regulator
VESYNCIIVDDDEVARLKVVSMAKRFPILHIVGYFSSAEAAIPVIEKERIDILFLDIQMSKMNGLTLRKKIMAVPVCVFITSYPEHAVESFEMDTLDFIVKPLLFDRFAQTMRRIEEFMELKQKATLFESNYGEDTIYVKQGYEQTKIKLYDILYIEALKDFTMLVTHQKRHCVSNGIGSLLQETHFQSFVRVHRSYAVQKHYVQKIGSHDITLMNNVTIPIGNTYKENISLVM